MSAHRDGAEVVQVRGEFDGTDSLAVYYTLGSSTFRAGLRPVRDGEALELSRLEQVEIPEDGGVLDYDARESVDLHSISHVPPVVREAVQRPVQTCLPDSFAGP